MHNLSTLTSGFLNAFPNIYFTSDTHFGHVRILELSGRPFADVDAHNQALIDNWNKKVQPASLVFHLGDVALGKIAESLPLVGQLNGYKILIPGNHDRVFSGEKEKMRVRFDPEYRKVFDEVWPEIVTGFIPHLGSEVILSHFPFAGDSQENDRHVDKRPTDSSLPLIHGHIHEKRRIEGNMFNVGVDVNGYAPVHHSVIRDWIESL